MMIYIQYLISASFFDFLCHQCTLPNPLIALPSPSITMVGSVCNWTNIMIRLPSQVLDLGVMIRLRFCERKKEACNYTFLILWWALNSAPSTMEMSFLGFNNVHDEFPPRASLIIKGRGYTDLLSYYLNADFIERLNHLPAALVFLLPLCDASWLLKKASFILLFQVGLLDDATNLQWTITLCYNLDCIAYEFLSTVHAIF